MEKMEDNQKDERDVSTPNIDKELRFFSWRGDDSALCWRPCGRAAIGGWRLWNSQQQEFFWEAANASTADACWFE